MTNNHVDISVEEYHGPKRLEKNTQSYIQITEKMLNTYISKNVDYGDSFADLYSEYGLLSTAIRLTDKINRLKNLAEFGAEVDESIEDTLEDLANYAIMTLIEIRKEETNASK